MLLHAGTGKGKTLAYLLPLVNQMFEAESTNDKVALIQPNALLKNQIKVVLERLSPEFQQNFQVITPRQLKYVEEASVCVIDEADLSLSAACLPPKTLLTSFLRAEFGKKGRRVIYSGATFPLESRDRSIRAQIMKYNPQTVVIEDDSVKEIAKRVAIDHENEKFVRFSNEKERIERLLEILNDSEEVKGKIMVFVRTKSEVNALSKELKATKNKNLIITTDSMSRGIDLDNLQHVIHFYPPMSAVEYVHRVGRLNRLNSKIPRNLCKSFCFVSDEDLSKGPLYLKFLLNSRKTVEDIQTTDISKFFSRNRSINKQIRRGKLSLP